MQELSHELLQVYALLFVQRSDQYAVQQRDGSYWRVVEQLTLSHLAAHLAGQWTLGSYVLDASSRCLFAVFDADGEDGLERLAQLSEELLREEVPTILEASRRGGHLWVHLVEATPASIVRAWLLPYARAMEVELYPKQDRLSLGGSGPLIRLPLGVHQQSRGWYPFIERSSLEGVFVPVGETIVECCAWVCQHVQRIMVPAVPGISVGGINSIRGELEGTEGDEPGQSAHPSGNREYRCIREWCQTYDIMAAIGRYVLLDDRGVGSTLISVSHTSTFSLNIL